LKSDQNSGFKGRLTTARHNGDFEHLRTEYGFVDMDVEFELYGFISHA